MKPIFKTDIALVVLGMASLISGITTHIAGHYYSPTAWQYASWTHGIINIGLLIATCIHIKQHWGWFKGLIKRPSFMKKIAFFITLSFIATLLSGIITLSFSRTPNTHAGLVHFFIGILFSALVIIATSLPRFRATRATSPRSANAFRIEPSRRLFFSMSYSKGIGEGEPTP